SHCASEGCNQRKTLNFCDLLCSERREKRFRLAEVEWHSLSWVPPRGKVRVGPRRPYLVSAVAPAQSQGYDKIAYLLYLRRIHCPLQIKAPALTLLEISSCYWVSRHEGLRSPSRCVFRLSRP